MSEHSALRPKGHIFIYPEFGPTIASDTLQCCHCGAHWQVMPGSGRRRGWCMRCNGPTCGKLPCDPCVPLKLRTEEPHKVADWIARHP